MSARDRKLLWPVILVLVVTLTALLWLSARTTASARSANTTLRIVAPTIHQLEAEVVRAPVLQGNSAKERLEAETITIRPTGFEPAEITRPKGPFIFTLINRSGREEVALRLDHETGNRERGMRVRKNKPNWRDVVDLPPGRYVLREINNPGWACRITITSR